MQNTGSQPGAGPLLTRCCGDVRLFMDSGAVRCRACNGLAMSGPGGLVMATDEEDDELDLEGYRRRTRDRYQSREYAVEYLRGYRAPRSAADLYARYIAARERRAVARCLELRAERIGTVLDIPAGTGKLAPVHERFPYRVVAADISVEMMVEGAVRGEWRRCENIAGFVRADIMNLRFEDDAVDCVVCLRLMHRLPEALVERALEELHRITRKYIVVSTGIRGASLMGVFQRVRVGRAQFHRKSWTNLLARFGTVESHHLVAPFVSTEIVSVLRVR